MCVCVCVCVCVCLGYVLAFATFFAAFYPLDLFFHTYPARLMRFGLMLSGMKLLVMKSSRSLVAFADIDLF